MNQTKITYYLKLFILVLILLFTCNTASAFTYQYHHNTVMPKNPLIEPFTTCSATPGLCLSEAKYPVSLNCSYKTEPNPQNTHDTLLTMTCSITNNTNQTLTDEYRFNYYYTHFYLYDDKPAYVWLKDDSLAGINPGETIIKTEEVAITPGEENNLCEFGYFVSRMDRKLLSPAWSTGPFLLENNSVLNATREYPDFLQVQQTKTLQITPGRFLRFAGDLVGHNIEISGSGEKYQVELENPNPSSTESFWMFGKTPDNPSQHWYNFTFDGETGAKFENGKLVLYFVDGKRGDMDITANGEISYLGGIATQYQDALYFPVPSIQDQNITAKLTIIEQEIGSNQVKLTFNDQNGQTIEQRTLDINGRETLVVDDIPDTTSLIEVNGWLVAGYVTITLPNGETFTSEALTDFSNDFPVPFALTADGFDTYITVTNPTDEYAHIVFNNDPNSSTDDSNSMWVKFHSSKTYHVKEGDVLGGVFQDYTFKNVGVSIIYRLSGTNKDGWSMANLSSSRSKTSKFPLSSQNGSWTAYLGANTNSSAATLYTAAGETIGGHQPVAAFQTNNNYYQGGVKVFGPSNASWADVNVGNPDLPDFGNSTVVVGSASGGLGAYLPLREGIKRGIIPLLSPDEGSTICNLINPHSEPSEVSVQGYSKGGEFVGGGVITIPAHGSLSVPIANDNIAMILFLAVDHPIVGNEVFQYKSGDIAITPLLSGFWQN